MNIHVYVDSLAQLSATNYQKPPSVSTHENTSTWRVPQFKLMTSTQVSQLVSPLKN